MQISKSAAAAWLLLALSCLHFPLAAALRLGEQASRGVELPELKAAALHEPCSSAFSQALTLCQSSPPGAPAAACCSGLEAAGAGCLSAALGALSSNQSLADGLGTIVDACGISLDGGGSPGGLAAGARLEHAWSVQEAGPAPCYNYLPQQQGNWTPDYGVGPWAASGRSVPDQSAVEAVYAALCKDAAAGSTALLQALGAGGAAAQAAVAAVARGPCPGSTDRNDTLTAAFYKFVASPQLQDPKTALRFAEAFVNASEAISAGSCITIAAVDSAGALKGSARVHTSQDRRSVGAGWGAGAGGSGGNLTGGGPGGGAPALPAGVVEAHLSFDPQPVACYNYTPGADGGNWTADSESGLWGGAGSAMPPTAAIEQVAAALCAGPAEGAAALQSALEAGGEAAQAAVKALMVTSCGKPGAVKAAISAFGASRAMNDPTQVMRYVQALVRAADETGVAMCLSLVVLDPDTGKVLASRQAHTSDRVNTTPAAGAVAIANCSAAIDAALDACIAEGGENGTRAGSACCEAVRGLGTPCLAELQAQADATEDAATMQSMDALLSQCGADPEPASAQHCAQGFKDAVAACSSGTSAASASKRNGGEGEGEGEGSGSCCEGIERLGRPCLARLALDPSLADAVENATAACLSANDSSASGGGLVSQPLPNGTVLSVWSVGQWGQCVEYNASLRDFQNSTTLPFRGTGFLRPSRESVAAALQRLCADPAQAPALLLQSLAGGGAAARSAVAALLSNADCPGSSGALDNVLDRIIAAAQVQDPKTAYGYVHAFVQAADDIGAGACVSLAVVDDAGRPLYFEQAHTGGVMPIGSARGSSGSGSIAGGGSSSGGSSSSRRWRSLSSGGKSSSSSSSSSAMSSGGRSEAGTQALLQGRRTGLRRLRGGSSTALLPG